MATIKICDRCGAQINPIYSGIVIEIKRTIGKNQCELCVSCAHDFLEWRKNKPFPKEESK